jgi:hypothetical protein
LKHFIRMSSVVMLSALLLLGLSAVAFADDPDLFFDEEQCEEFEVDGEVVLICEDDEGILYVCLPLAEFDDNDHAETPPAARPGEGPDEVDLLCFEVDEDHAEEISDGTAGVDTVTRTPVGGIATGAGGTAGEGAPRGAAVAALVLLLGSASVVALRRFA